MPNIITTNNIILSVLITPILLVSLFPRVKKWGLVYTDVMDERDRSTGIMPKLGLALVVAGSIGGVIAVNVILAFSGGADIIDVALIPFVLMLVVGAVLL